MISSYQDYKYYLKQDKEVNGRTARKSTSAQIKEFFFPCYEWKFLQYLRRLEYCENVIKKTPMGIVLWFITKNQFRRISVKLGYSIPINVFGPGLSLPHRGNIIVNPNTKIGNNCRIHVGVNIGAHHDRAPRIGHNVYIGPGAIIFGDIEIADNVCIGANATVNKSILVSHTVVAGTPAKIVKSNIPSWNGIKPTD